MCVVAGAVALVEGVDAVVLVVGLTSEGVPHNDEAEGPSTRERFRVLLLLLASAHSLKRHGLFSRLALSLR